MWISAIWDIQYKHTRIIFKIKENSIWAFVLSSLDYKSTLQSVQCIGTALLGQLWSTWGFRI